MRKSYVILIYIVVLLLASLGVGALVWSDLKGNTIDEKYYNNYITYKEKLINHSQYSSESEDITIEVVGYKSKDTYLISTSFTNPQENYKDLIILVIDEKEKNEETNKIYPSLGIIGNFNNEFVVSNPNKKNTHSKITMDYESTFKSSGVLIYLEYTDNNNTVISRLNLPIIYQD